MISPEFSTSFTIAIYMLASIVGLAGMILQKNTYCTSGCWLACLAFFCQTLLLTFGFHKFFPNGLSIGAYLQMFAWFILVCGLGVWIIYRQKSFLLFAAQFGLILFLMSAPWLDVTLRIPANLETPFYILHIGALFLFMGIISIAFVASILFLFLSFRIKYKKKMDGFWHDLPALAVLDKVNALCVFLAFPIFSTGIIFGFIWSAQVFGSMFDADPKKVVSLIVWILLAILFHNRLANGWKGRKPAWIVITIFLISIFSVSIINYFIPTMHNFVN